MNRVQVEALLIADKGRKPGQFAVPPVQYDSAGYPFAVAPDGRIALCNDANLIRLDPRRNTKRLLHAPFGERTDFWGVACTSDILVVMLSDYTIAVLNWDGRIRQRFGEGFGEGKNQINDAPPVRMAIAPSGMQVWMQGESLYRIAVQDGQIERVVEAKRGNSLTGLAQDPSGRVYVSSEEPMASTERFQWRGTPACLKQLFSENCDWSLFGIDELGNFYWRGERFEKRGNYPIAEVACVAPDGRLRWRLTLNGSSGVIQRLQSDSQIQWLEVDRRGRLYALGWAYRGLQKRVGLFRVDVR